jgi:ABC-type cobalamin/Fe3+-siderophores transport system ATPase subunit
MLDAQKISVVRQGRRLLDGVSCSFRPGAVNIVIGPNGAGKSTLLACLAGLIEPNAGHVTLDSTDIKAMDCMKRAQTIAFLPQNGEVNWDVRARDLVALGRYSHRHTASASEDQAAISRAMADADCSQFAERNIVALSGGERARVMLARVLAGQPKWLLADEPLANLDPKYQLQLLAILRARALDGTGVIAVLHDLTLAARTADHVVLMRDGAIFAAGPAKAVMTTENLNSVFGIDCEILSDSGGRMAIVSN